MRNSVRFQCLFALVGASLWSSASVPFPYVENFIKNPLVNTNYATTCSTEMTLSYDYDENAFVAFGESGAGNYSLVTGVAGLGDGAEVGFTMSASFSVSSVWNQERLFALAPTTAGSSGYSGFLRSQDVIRIMEGSTVLASAAWSGNSTGDFKMILTGEYNALNELELTLTVSDGTTRQTISTVDSAPLTGLYFGVGGRIVQDASTSWNEWQIGDGLFIFPHEDEFTEDPQLNDFYTITASPELALSHDSTNHTFVAVGDTDVGNLSLMGQFGGLEGTNETDFAVSSTFSTEEKYNQLKVFARCADGAGAGYVGYLRPRDTLKIMAGTVVVTSAVWTGSTTGTFDLTLSGNYNENGALDISLAASDGMNRQALSWSTVAPSTNNWFGIGGRVAGTGVDKALVMENVKVLHEAYTLTLAPQRPSAHPRLLLNDDQLAAIQLQAQTDSLMADLLTAVEDYANAYTNSSPLVYSTVDTVLMGQARAAVGRILDWALMYRLTGESIYFEKARSELLNVCSFPAWYNSQFLRAGEMSFAVSIGYDWLYNELSQSDRATIEQALVDKVLSLAPDAYAEPEDIQGGAGWYAFSETSALAYNNHNQVCNAGYLYAALALWDVEPELAELVVEGARRSLPNAMQYFAPGGAWMEGPVYWSYGLTYNVLGVAALEENFGSAFNLQYLPGFEQTTDYGAQIFGPRGVCFNFADCGNGHDDTIGQGGHLTWLAETFDQPGVLDYVRTRLSEHLLNLPEVSGTAGNEDRFLALNAVWFPEAQSGCNDYSLDAFYDGPVEVAVFRSEADEPNALWLAAKAGENGLSHGHLDLGSFVLESDGVRWGIDLGGDSYALPGYWKYENGGTRWTYYRCSSLSHNTINVGTNLQDATATAHVTAYQSETNEAFVVMDLTDVYPVSATKIQRGIAMLDRSRLLIQDEMTGLQSGAPVAWRMLTGASVAVAQDGLSATLTKDGKTLRADLLDPTSGAQFEAVAPPPLSAEENELSGVTVLQIEYTPNSADERVAVLLTPVGTSWPTLSTPTLTNLSDW